MYVIAYLVDKEANKMAFDYKKEYKEFYMPKNKPDMNWILRTQDTITRTITKSI